MTINVQGPDGSNLAFPDGTPEGVIVEAMTAHYGGAKPSEPPAFDKNDPRFSGGAAVGGKFLEGVPVLGAYVPQAGAALSAAAQPLTGVGKPGESFSERYAANLPESEAASKAFEAENPGTSIGLKVGGGIAGTLPLVAAAPAAFGVTGTMGQMVGRGALSGAGLSAADEAARGGDITHGAGVGAITGAAGGPLGRAIGKVAASLGRDRSAPPVPLQTADVAGVKVPIPPQGVDDAGIIEAARKGSSGDAAKAVVLDSDAATTKALEDATNRVAANIAGEAAPAERATSSDAARAVQEHLQGAEQTRFQTDAARAQRAALEGGQVRGDMNAGVVGQPLAVDSAHSAAESVGGGVAGARDAAVARTRGLYDRVRDEPGVFDPAVPRGLSEELRARINTGDDALWVDPQSTSKANEALKLIDQTVGEGLFKNAAAPKPSEVLPGSVSAPAAAPAAAAAPSDAEIAFAQLTAKGATPERARAAVANLPGADALPRTALEPHSVATASGGSVELVPKVVEASSIKTSADPGYIQDLQPRNRQRAASNMQIQDMAKNITPNRLGVSTEADRGAPITGPDQMVESGNGRVLALRQAYAENGAQAAKYREWLQSQGVDVSKYREPVLVRERTTPMSHDERKAFTVAANQSSTLSLSGAERALADSRALSPETLGLIRNPADLAAVDNREFVRQFMQSVPAAERAGLMTASGDLSSEGLTRIRNAVMAKAYGNSSILARAAESTKDEVKSISQGLQAAAPEWAQLRAGVAAGAVPKELDATAHLLDAVERTAKIRGKGTPLAEGLAQTDAFAAQSPESEAFMRLFYSADGKSAAPAGQIGNALRDIAQQAAKVDAAPGLGLGLEPVALRDILAVTSKKVGAPQALAKEVAEAATAPVEASKTAAIPEVGLKEMDSARKRLVTMFGDARRAAMAPGGSQSDVRAMGRILHEFDNVIIEAFDAGRFSGDGEVAKGLLRDARASHTAYRQTFTSRGGADPVGRSVEKILGRYADTAATPDEIARLSYGSAAEPGGGDAVRVSQRLRQILGPTSPEWGAYKQGLFEHVRGGGSPVEQADRIEKFLRPGSKGNLLAQSVLSDAERGAMATHAQNLRSAAPVELSSLRGVDRVVAKISGRLDGIPSSTKEVIDFLAGGAKDAGGKGLSVVLAQRLEREMTPEAFAKVRQGLLSHVMERPEGVSEWGPKVIADNMHKFLNSSLALAMYKPAQLKEIKALADAVKAQIPPAGVVNTSNSATVLHRMARGVSSMFLPAIGLASHGPGGALVGLAANKAVAGIKNARAARDIRNLLYEKPSAGPVDPRFAKAAAAVTRGSMQGQIENRQ